MLYNVKGEKIYYINQLEGEKLLNVFLAGITVPNPNYKSMHNITRENEFDKYNFEYVFRGKGYIETGGHVHTVQAGDFFFLNKLKPHIYYTDPVDLLEKIFITVNGPLIDHLVEAYGLIDSVLVLRVDVYDLLDKILKLLAQLTSENKVETFDRVGLLIHEMIQTVCRDRLANKRETERKGQRGEPQRRPCEAQQILNYIENNLDINLTLDDIAAYFYRSKANIIHLFKAEYQKTPIQYLLTRKVEIARRLLTYTKLSVEEVSGILAFSSSKHFCKMFGKVTGISPSQYRKLYTNGLS